MEGLFVIIFKMAFWIFTPIFKGIAWIFISIFKAIGKAIGGLVVRKGKEAAPKVATAVGVGAVVAGATVISEEMENAKLNKKTVNAKNKTGSSYDNASSKNPASIKANDIRVYKVVTDDGMNFKQMKALIGAIEDNYVEDALKYWKALEDADQPEFANIRTSLWA